MTDSNNKIAWFAAALAILAWAFVPRLVEAHPVYFPKVPNVGTINLPPFGSGKPVDGNSLGD